MPKLAGIGFRIASCPALMLKCLSFSYPYKIRAVKSMLIAKLVNTDNGIFNAFWRRDDHRPFPLHHASFHGNAHFRAGFRGVLASEACQSNFLSRLRRVLSACNGQGTLADSLFAILLTDTRLTRLFNRFRSVFHTQWRASNASDIVSSLAKRAQFRKPVLFTCRQQFRDKYQFENFKDESIGAVLFPCRLQLNIPVVIALKTTVMFIATSAKIESTANVELTCNCAGKAINAGGIREALMVQWNHSYHPSYQGGSLGLGRASNTLLGRFISSHYTTKPASRLASCPIQLY